MCSTGTNRRPARAHHAVRNRHIAHGRIVEHVLQADRVIFTQQHTIGDRHVLGTHQIDAIVVVLGAVQDRNAMNVHVRAAQEVRAPRPGILERQSFERQPPTPHQADEHGAFSGCAIGCRRCEAAPLAINHPWPGERDVLGVGRVQQTLVDMSRSDKTTGFDVGGIVRQIGASQNGGRARHMQVHVALEEYGTGQILAGRNQHGTAPIGATLVNRRLDG